MRDPEIMKELKEVKIKELLKEWPYQFLDFVEQATLIGSEWRELNKDERAEIEILDDRDGDPIDPEEYRIWRTVSDEINGQVIIYYSGLCEIEMSGYGICEEGSWNKEDMREAREG